MLESLINDIKEAYGDTGALGLIYESIAQREQSFWADVVRRDVKNWTEQWQLQVDQRPDATVVTDSESGSSTSYKKLDNYSLHISLQIERVTQERYVGVYQENSVAMLATIIAINRMGRVAVLFNPKDPPDRIRNLADTCGVSTIVGKPVSGRLTIHLDDQSLAAESVESLSREEIAGFLSRCAGDSALDDPAFVIFTSGTSGASKPALFSHRRMIGAGIAWSIRTAMDPSDRCYICLPLCHGNGLAVAFSSVVTTGGCAVIRKRFSVSCFWDDINLYGCTHMVYIGEIWRYLLQGSPRTANNETLRVIFGNGLVADVWAQVVARFAIRHVVEHYGATEMPASALTNWTGRVGSCGFVPPGHPDQDAIKIVNEDFKDTTNGGPGEILLRIPDDRDYRGYLTPELNGPKIVKLTEDQAWWRSGDVLRRSEDGHYYFQDRLGDNYRFKGENVSALDVEQALMKITDVIEATVYGVSLPKIDGRIGMASLVMTDLATSGITGQTELGGLLGSMLELLPRHAIPHLLKIGTERHATTSTYKIIKSQLSLIGIDSWSDQAHFALINGSFEQIDRQLYEQIMQGAIKLGF